MHQSCFTGETLVSTEDGQKRIDEIELGDKVWAYDVETGETELKEVTKVYIHETDKILHLHTSCGDIDTTTNHPFYVLGEGWVAAGDLSEGDEVYQLDGSIAVVIGSEIEKLDEPIKVYNLEVEDYHSYFVGNVPVLVHNYEPENRNKMQKEVERGQAPRGVDRVDPPHNPNVPNQQPHVHFSDGTSMNCDGTIHDARNGLPVLTKKTAKWLESFGWSSTPHFRKE